MEHDLHRVTVRKSDIVTRPCTPCGTTTVHIGKTNGETGNTCLQCLVDGGNSAASFAEWSRWIDPKTGKTLTSPRGYKSKPAT